MKLFSTSCRGLLLSNYGSANGTSRRLGQWTELIPARSQQAST